jgi:dienelactone hydrolase
MMATSGSRFHHPMPKTMVAGMTMVTVMERRVGRSRSSGRRGITLGVLLVSAILLSACVAAEPPPPPAPPTRGSTFPAVTAPAPGVLAEVARPPGAATSPGADHWYRYATSGGHSVELAVYLPASPLTTPPITVLALHGGNGLHRSLETLARGYAQQGFIGIAGCWFDQPEGELTDDSVSCSGGPPFQGTQAGATDSLDALVAAVKLVPGGVTADRIAIVGHSYGAGAALMRAADRGVTEPIVSASGVLAREPNCCGNRAGDRYPTENVAAITGPVFVVHAYGDPITPIGQAVSFLAALDASRAGQPATPRVFYGSPAAHELPFQGDAYGGSTVAAQFLADTTAWIVLQFP